MTRTKMHHHSTIHSNIRFLFIIFNFYFSVTFLYKVTRGAAMNSYGLNVARIAGIPTSVSSFFVLFLFYFIVLFGFRSFIFKDIN